MLWVVHDEREIWYEGGLGREGVLANAGGDGGGVENWDGRHTRDPLHLSYGCLGSQKRGKIQSVCHLDIGQQVQVSNWNFFLSEDSEDLLSAPSERSEDFLTLPVLDILVKS